MNPFKKGDTVRLKRDPKSIEKVGRVDDERVYVCFGFFTIAYRPEDLELVKPADLTNDAPRRRTEPAITVPPLVSRESDLGVRTPWGVVCAIDYPAAEYVLDGGADRISAEAFYLWRKGLLQWMTHEVEACKSHGAAAYACMAADCDQVREILAVEEAKAEMEAWRLSNAEWLDHYTDSDSTGELHEEVWHDTEAERGHWERWLAGLTPPLEHEHMSDWAARQEPGPRGSQTKAYMQHLFDKLAKGEVVGG